MKWDHSRHVPASPLILNLWAKFVVQAYILWVRGIIIIMKKIFLCAHFVFFKLVSVRPPVCFEVWCSICKAVISAWGTFKGAPCFFWRGPASTSHWAGEINAVYVCACAFVSLRLVVRDGPHTCTAATLKCPNRLLTSLPFVYFRNQELQRWHACMEQVGQGGRGECVSGGKEKEKQRAETEEGEDLIGGGHSRAWKVSPPPLGSEGRGNRSARVAHISSEKLHRWRKPSERVTWRLGEGSSPSAAINKEGRGQGGEAERPLVALYSSSPTITAEMHNYTIPA